MRKKRRFLLKRTHQYANMAVGHGGRRPGVPAAKKERARSACQRPGPRPRVAKDSRHVQRTRPPRVGPARHHTARHRTPFHCHRIIALFVDPIPRGQPARLGSSPEARRVPGARYTARITEHGHPACTCPDHQNRGTVCKHLGALIAARLLTAPLAAPAPLARSRSARRPKAVRS